ncbi:Cys-tRNA(Pro) deacylase [Ornithinimicrobium sp. Y1694]|uniref:Cys-tRNA(Pro) deacylase n=1 Tax=Ornithinimicrobium sp. Y1694 TaxID=3418590 RepID=UPI003CF1AA65
MAKKKQTTGTGGTPATVALEQARIPYAVRAYEHDPATESYGLEAAEALGVDADRVFKTLLVDSERGLGVGIVPVNTLLDLKAVAAALGAKKATMADPKVAERTTGYVVGGISPIGQKKALPTVVDESALDFDTVLVSGGKRGLDLELAPTDLLQITGGLTAPIARRA